jgi:hypothetical protein
MQKEDKGRAGPEGSPAHDQIRKQWGPGPSRRHCRIRVARRRRGWMSSMALRECAPHRAQFVCDDCPAFHQICVNVSRGAASISDGRLTWTWKKIGCQVRLNFLK